MTFLITAGPTREPIDPVRYFEQSFIRQNGLCHCRSGAGSWTRCDLDLRSSEHRSRRPGAKLISISTSDEMHEAVHRHLAGCDILVMCAAVADYKPARASAQKIKKSNQPFSLDLVPTRDILASLPKQNRQFLIVGFAAETKDLEKYANKKLREKSCDIIVANDVATGMETDENEVIVLFRTGERQKISRAQKQIIARELVKIFLDSCEKCLTKKM